MTDQQQYRDQERMDLASASKLERIVACPGSMQLEATLPPEAFQLKPAEEDEWAESGTRIHAAFENDNTLELSEEENRIYQDGVKFEKMIVEKWMRDKGLDRCEEGPRELRIWLHDTDLNPIASMKMDRHYFNKEKGCLLLTDLKSGWNPNLPKSPKSWQLRFGAVTLWKEEYDWIKDVRVGYCKAQSKYTVNDFCDYTEADLIRSWESIQFHIWESKQPGARRVPGPHCTFCPCKSYCMEGGAYAMLPTVIARNAVKLSDAERLALIDKMAPADLVRIWDASTIIGKILDEVKARLKRMAPEQLADLGIEFGTARKNDKVADTNGAFLELTKHFVEQDVLKCFDVSKSKALELIRAQKSMTKANAEQWFDKTLDPYIERKTGEAPLRRIK